ncbi:MAG: glycosyltransferase family A protein [Chloroflexota bacterium]|nr:glycosyltransferase family A protein [Chloroflexota bacterium]
MSPLVSVIVPVYNGARFLPDVITTVREQAYAPLEVVLIDDGSTDGGGVLMDEIAFESSDWSVRVVHQPNLGAAGARNTGVARARGGLIKFLDVDDLLPPGSIAAQVARLSAQPDLDILSGLVQMVLMPDARLDNPVTATAAPMLSFNLGAALIRSDVIARAGGFDQTMAAAEDMDFFLRCVEMDCTIAIAPTISLYYRRHADNMTAADTLARQQTHLMRCFRRSLARRRQPDGTIIAPMRDWGSFLETMEIDVSDKMEPSM